jgi:phosphatidyl-N-methylethanolamine N-methyltransferase
MPVGPVPDHGRAPAGRKGAGAKSLAPRVPAAASGGGPAAAKKEAASRSRGKLLMTTVGLLALGAGVVSLSVKLPLTTQSKQDLERLWLCCAAVSIPHLFYFWLWRTPQRWIVRAQRLKVDPSESMARVAVSIKSVQAMAFILWLHSATTAPQIFEEFKTRLVRNDPLLVVAVGMVVAGQCLNAGVFRAIGVHGVYYGIKFGKKIPWATAWPFGGFLAVPHPQYVGCVLTIWGLILGACTRGHYESGALGLGIFWSLLYVWTGLVEEFF